jgi:hypothetical protein
LVQHRAGMIRSRYRSSAFTAMRMQAMVERAWKFAAVCSCRMSKRR